MLRVCFIFVLIFWPAFAAATEVQGRIKVTDGDTIRVGDTLVRLHGIDAPEVDQTCRTEGNHAFACGAWVSAEVRRRYDGRMARCARVDRDRYGRIVARCRVDGQDMGRALVAEGLAFAFRRYSMDYDLEEKAAFATRRGLHGFSVTSPVAFRQARARARQQTPPDANCAIKGNISAQGRIYHLPGQVFYDDTRINIERGERWFCNEPDARAASWRRAAR